MSDITRVLPEELIVGRGDPVYMAHAYLTKVPVPAIVPFIQAFSEPGAVVVDPFAGSGMTGVAAAATGRRARLSDISVLGQHIGANYVNLVDANEFRASAELVVKAAAELVGDIYAVHCDACQQHAVLTKAVWSAIFHCEHCGGEVNYYEALRDADWHKSAMRCNACSAPVSAKLRKIREEPVVDAIECRCSRTQREQPSQSTHSIALPDLTYPHVEITPDRQMYKASALGRHGHTTVASFYSSRNLAVLAALHRSISEIVDEAMRGKLLFAFTASLTRASKRYQWSRKRPLNAANANYYVAPVFYEWNVFDLFTRKVEAAIRSDDWIRRQLGHGSLFASNIEVDYRIGSAENIVLPDASVDYVFTDPPFGSNLFYADMALFQEAWLNGFTDVELEAVIDRGTRKRRGATRYEQMLSSALCECRRVLKPDGRVSMVFGNSSGAVWHLVQRAVHAARLRIDPDQIVILNKGQRSVKGLASGFEDVATLDLVLTMEPYEGPPPELRTIPQDELDDCVAELLQAADGRTPSHLYLELLRVGLQRDWSLGDLDLRHVIELLERAGLGVDAASGSIVRED